MARTRIAWPAAGARLYLDEMLRTFSVKGFMFVSNVLRKLEEVEIICETIIQNAWFHSVRFHMEHARHSNETHFIFFFINIFLFTHTNI